jgi:hypothetical protein
MVEHGAAVTRCRMVVQMREEGVARRGARERRWTGWNDGEVRRRRTGAQEEHRPRDDIERGRWWPYISNRFWIETVLDPSDRRDDGRRRMQHSGDGHSTESNFSQKIQQTRPLN